MAELFITCPVTGQPASANVNLPLAATEGFTNVTTDCRACGGSHMWSHQHLYEKGQPPKPAPAK